jgi:hypothetical protein
MVHHIKDGANSNLPEWDNRPEVYYYSRHFLDAHLAIPPGYDIEALQAVNGLRSDGWKAANAIEE